MDKIMKVYGIPLAAAILMSSFSPTIVLGAEDTVKKTEISCWPSAKFEEYINGKGYYHLLDMKDEKNTVNSIWAGGRSAVVTTQKPKVNKDDKDYTCFLTGMKDVIFNPDTIEKIYKVIESQRKPT